MILERLFLWFMLYSTAGWLYETVYCSLTAGKFVYRGFLAGPYCPIYGFGAVFDVLFIGWIENPVLLFFAGMLINCSLEYFTSWLLEQVFQAKWWDYSGRKFNIKGRVCLAGALVFGAFAVVLLKFIHPFVASVTSYISDEALVAVTGVLLAVILVDTAYSIIKTTKFQEKLKYLHECLSDALNASDESGERRLPSPEANRLYELLREKMKLLSIKLTTHERRTLRSFPRFRSTRYNDVLEALREHMKAAKERQSAQTATVGEPSQTATGGKPSQSATGGKPSDDSVACSRLGSRL